MKLVYFVAWVFLLTGCPITLGISHFYFRQLNNNAAYLLCSPAVSSPAFALQRWGRSRVPQLWRKWQGAGHQRAQLQESLEEVRLAVPLLSRTHPCQQRPAETLPDDWAGAGGNHTHTHIHTGWRRWQTGWVCGTELFRCYYFLMLLV